MLDRLSSRAFSFLILSTLWWTLFLTYIGILTLIVALLKHLLKILNKM